MIFVWKEKNHEESYYWTNNWLIIGEFICNFYLLNEIVCCLLIGTNMRWKERREGTEGKNRGQEIDHTKKKYKL